ncbi:MAG: TonB-dependent receptor [Vicinamibacteria bacterium]
MIDRSTRFLRAAALLAFTAGAAQAQQSGGSIRGTVHDSSGGGIPGVAITATNLGGGAAATATTGADGTFSVNVAPGVYSVTAALRGFGRQSKKDVKVAAGGSVTADFTLQAQREEEVTVTATKREETLSNVPFAVAAPTEQIMQSRGIENIEAVAANVAGFAVQNLGPGQSQVSMRGVSSGQIVRDQPGVKEQVGAYLDESVISLSLFTPDLDLFDVARVEVLRGPQGTLFGSGSLSGTVRYITNQPEIGASKWFAEVGGKTLTGGAGGGDAKLGGNVKLGEKAALRVVGYYSKIPGYIDAVQPNLSVKKDVNGGDRAGVRAAIQIKPNDKLSITPRIVYQKVTADGWNRIDAYNILANPFTTTRPAVTLGERQQFTQLQEAFTDKFWLGDLNVRYNFGKVDLTSVTSYTDRDVLVVRDATALTASITGGSIGLPARVYSLNAPLDDATKAKSWTQEVRLSGETKKFRWVAGGFYSSTKRKYGQSLLVSGFQDLTGIPTAGSFGAARDVLFYSDLSYNLHQFAAFGEGTLSVTDKFSLTGGLRYYDFKEDRTQVFDGIFADPASKPGTIKANGVAPRIIATLKVSDTTNLNAQVAKGFRLGGINDQLNVPLCTREDLATFGGRDAWKDERAWNYEVGSKSRISSGRGSFNVSAFDMEVTDLQATVTAGSCSSRVIFNVPKARSRGFEAELAMAPNSNFDFSISGSYADSQLQSTLTSGGSVVSGIQSGNRLPSVPKLQASASATYQWQLKSDALLYLTGTYQYSGSRFTQIGDQGTGFGTVNLLSFGAGTIGAPLRATTFTFNPELPAYTIVNARIGLARDKWDLSLYGNNLTDEIAFLALDQERGTRARVGYLTNPPRSLGVTLRVKF